MIISSDYLHSLIIASKRARFCAFLQAVILKYPSKQRVSIDPDLSPSYTCFAFSIRTVTKFVRVSKTFIFLRKRKIVHKQIQLVAADRYFTSCTLKQLSVAYNRRRNSLRNAPYVVRGFNAS